MADIFDTIELETTTEKPKSSIDIFDKISPTIDTNSEDYKNEMFREASKANLIFGDNTIKRARPFTLPEKEALTSLKYVQEKDRSIAQVVSLGPSVATGLLGAVKGSEIRKQLLQGPRLRCRR